MKTNRLMFKTQILLLAPLSLLVLSSTAWPITYYVDATYGNDANTGTSESKAWQSVNKVNNSTFDPGDSILFKRGQTFRGYTLQPPSSGSSGSVITFDQYSTGNNPIISGAAKATGSWTDEGSNQWSIAFTGASWNGSVSTAPSEVYFDDDRGFETTGTSYLHHEKDWYYDSENTRLYVYTANAGGPASEWTDIEAATVEQALYVDNKDYITIQNIVFEKTHMPVARLNSASNVTIDTCQFHAPGRGNDYRYFSGLNIYRSCSDIVVNGCTFGRASDNNWSGSQAIRYGHTGTSAGDVIIQNNTIYWTTRSDQTSKVDITSGTWTNRGLNRYTHAAATGNSEHMPVDVYFAYHEGTHVDSSSEIDAEFEWWYDPSNNTLWVYSPSGSPASYYGLVEYSDNFNLTAINGGWEEYTDHGIYISNFDSGTLLIHNNTIDHARDIGIYAEGDNAGDIIISNNTITYSGHTGIQPTAQHSDIGTVTVTKNLVDNTCYKSGGSMAIHANGSTTTTIIEHNEVRNTKSVPANMEDGGGIGIDYSENSTVRYNYIHDNWGKGLYVYGYNENNFSIYGNVLHGNDSGFIIGARNGYVLRNVSIYNNTFYKNNNGDSKGPNYDAEILIDNINGLTLQNNIMYSHDRGYCIWRGGGLSNVTIDYNAYYKENGTICYDINGGPRNFAQWRNYGYETDGINSNPLLKNPSANDFTLEESSPCIDAGTPVGLPFNGPAPDMGAFEYGLDPPPPPSDPPPEPPKGLKIL
ncbi:MAG: right-handed parallel beta-helix repeat-containing protein [Candidatus Hodarchaeota archaeon]